MHHHGGKSTCVKPFVLIMYANWSAARGTELMGVELCLYQRNIMVVKIMSISDMVAGWPHSTALCSILGQCARCEGPATRGGIHKGPGQHR